MRLASAENDGQWLAERVLITGVSGVLGLALRNELEQHNFQSVFSVSSSDADMTDQTQTERLLSDIRPALIFHLAARVSGIMGNLVAQGSAFLDNCRINTNLIEASRRYGARKIVALGTTAIYSDLAPLPKSEADIWLGPPHASEAGYGHAKRSMLAQLDAYRDQYGLDFAYCISTNLFGPGDRFDEKHGHVIPSLISKFHRGVHHGDEVTVWGSGEPRRDFLYSRDAARALRVIADRWSGPINLVSGRTTTIKQCAELIAQAAGYTAPIRWDTTKPDGQMMREYDYSGLATMGVRPPDNLKYALQETYNWYADNVDVARR